MWIKIYKKCFCLGILLSLVFHIFLSLSGKEQLLSNTGLFSPFSHVFVGDLNVSMQIFWHLDLKGSPPLVEVIENYFNLTSMIGATGVLVEFEDMFPFEGYLKNVSAVNAYSKNNLKHLWEVAQENGLEIVPLIQCLGHLEYILKLENFVHLREMSSIPSDACASNPQTEELVLEAISQVLDVFPSKIIHIGGDEVLNIGKCVNCQNRNISPVKIYIQYMLKLATKIKHRWGVRVLMWDDMIRHASNTELKAFHSLVEPVVWAYSESVIDIVPKRLQIKYSQSFSRQWVASSFKGASYANAVLPNIYQTVTNTLSWLKLSSEINSSGYRKQISKRGSIIGIFITGWSRYNHFADLCELLPSAVPSLIYAILVSTHFSNRHIVKQKLKDILKCPDYVTLDILNDPLLLSSTKCRFKGYEIMKFVSQFLLARHSLDVLTQTAKDRNWLRSFHKINLDKSLATMNLNLLDTSELKGKIAQLSDTFYSTFKFYFDNSTMEEWYNQNILQLHNNWKQYELSYNISQFTDI